MTLIDSQGHSFKVEQAIKTKTIWSWPDVLFLNPFVKVKLTTTPLEKTWTLPELKQLLIQQVHAKDSYWRASGQVKYILSKIEAAHNIEELFNTYHL